MHDIIAERAVSALPGITAARLFCASAMKDSLKSQSGWCGKLTGRSTCRLRKEILGTGDKESRDGIYDARELVRVHT